MNKVDLLVNAGNVLTDTNDLLIDKGDFNDIHDSLVAVNDWWTKAIH